MPHRPPIHRPSFDVSRPTQNEHKYLYRRRDWKVTRARKLAETPFCEATLPHNSKCSAIATEVDHIRPHRGDTDLFWDWANLQSLCESCHSRKTMDEVRNRRY